MVVEHIHCTSQDTIFPKYVCPQLLNRASFHPITSPLMPAPANSPSYSMRCPPACTTTHMLEVIPSGNPLLFKMPKKSITASTTSPMIIAHHGRRILIPRKRLFLLVKLSMTTSLSSRIREIEMPHIVPVIHPACCTPGSMMHPIPVLKDWSMGWMTQSPSRTAMPKGWKSVFVRHAKLVG